MYSLAVSNIQGAEDELEEDDAESLDEEDEEEPHPKRAKTASKPAPAKQKV